MLRAFMSRHGAHHVNIWSLSGSRARPVSTSPLPMMRSSSARSSGSWPTARGFRSFGCTSISVRAMFRSPHRIAGCPAACRSAVYCRERLEKAHLRRKVLAAVRYVDGREGHALDGGGHDPALVVEGGVVERGTLGREGLADVQADARIPLRSVPVAPVALHLAQRGRHLVRHRLDLLEADDVGLLPFDPFLHLGLPRTDPVHVPRRDFHLVDRLYVAVRPRPGIRIAKLRRRRGIEGDAEAQPWISATPDWESWRRRLQIGNRIPFHVRRVRTGGLRARRAALRRSPS